jgi:hypothetical protein
MLPHKDAQKRSKITSIVKQSIASCGKQKENATLRVYFMPRTTYGAQKSLQSCWKKKVVE